jgi:hypothetical protein
VAGIFHEGEAEAKRSHGLEFIPKL